MHVLIVEDHADVAATLQMGLEECGYSTEIAEDGIKGELKVRTGAFDLLVVDWMLPGQDGPSLIQRLRQDGIDTPALMLTARVENVDQVEALNVGADDYLSKPFSFDVLVARLKALARRAAGRGPDDGATVVVGDVRLDLRQRIACVGDVEVDLREKEFKLLVLLAEHPNQVLTRTTIAEQVWHNVYATDDVLNTTVASLRRKLREAFEDGADGVNIETLRGVGYRLRIRTTA